MTGPSIGHVLIHAVEAVGGAIRDGAAAVSTLHGSTSAGLHHTASSHEQNDTHHAGVFRKVSFDPNTTTYTPHSTGSKMEKEPLRDSGSRNPPETRPYTPHTSTGAGTVHEQSHSRGNRTENTRPSVKERGGDLERLTNELTQKIRREVDQAHPDDQKRRAQALKKRPGASGTLMVGHSRDGWTSHSHTSMKGGPPKNPHPAVQTALDDIGVRDEDGTPMGNMNPHTSNEYYETGRGHGQCAEVGAVSNYLLSVNPAGDWTLDQVRRHFDNRDAIHFAQSVGSENYIPPCGSCSNMLNMLGIHGKDFAPGADEPYGW